MIERNDDFQVTEHQKINFPNTVYGSVAGNSNQPIFRSLDPQDLPQE
jgi:hypothetical protein